MVNRNSKTMVAAVALTSAAWVNNASAGQLAIYGNSIDFENEQFACLTIGDAISCSAPLLNVLNGMGANTETSNGGYVFHADQGVLRSSYIVVAGGGGSGENSTIDPAPHLVEDGYSTNVNPDAYFATGTTGSTLNTRGQNPDNNDLPDTQDQLGTWDIDIGWLIESLTFGDDRRQLLIGFDYNQPQNATDQTLDYWALISVWSSTDPTLPFINYEIREPTGLSYSDFTSSYGFNDKPHGHDFATVNGISCVYNDAGANLLTIISQPGGSCPTPASLGLPAGSTVTTIDNTLATSRVEFIAWLPELDAQLHSFRAQGYDTISTRLLLGCFDTPHTGPSPDRSGQGYLSGGFTNNCDVGGFPDIFLMAGDLIPTNEVPAPAPLLLIGAGLLGLTSLRWRGRRRG